MPSEVFEFELNGRATEVMARPLATLNRVLREQLQLKAAKAGCRQGGCGSCTVMLDGEPVLSCLLAVANVAGRSVTTLEAWAGDDPLQRIFHERLRGPVRVLRTGNADEPRALLDRNPSPTREEIAEAISGNVCRCTGYESIIDAIADAAA